MLPRTNGIFTEPAPHGLVAEGGDQTAAFDLAGDVATAEARQRQAARGGQLAGDGLNQGENILAGPRRTQLYGPRRGNRAWNG
jgi:hypothetical protein